MSHYHSTVIEKYEIRLIKSFVISSAYCFCRRPEFNSQHPLQAGHSFLQLQLQRQISSSDFCRNLFSGVHKYTQTHIHTYDRKTKHTKTGKYIANKNKHFFLKISEAEMPKIMLLSIVSVLRSHCLYYRSSFLVCQINCQRGDGRLFNFLSVILQEW